MSSNALKFAEYRIFISLLRHVLRFKYRVLFLAVIISLSAFGLSYLMSPKYSATSIVAFNLAESRGGVSPGDYRSGDTLGVIEYDFLIKAAQKNELERMLTRMESYNFIEGFIQNNELLPILFNNTYDSVNTSWPEGEPDMREAVSKFKKEIFSVYTDKKTDLLQISFTTADPELSATLANQVVLAFNAYIREIEISQIEKQRNYLEARLSKVRNAELQRSIFRLLETQLSLESLLNARDNFPLEMIQPATVPLYKAYPARKKWAVVAFILTIILSYVSTLGWAAISSLRTDLKLVEEESPLEKGDTEAEGIDWISDDREGV